MLGSLLRVSVWFKKEEKSEEVRQPNLLNRMLFRLGETYLKFVNIF